MFVWISKQTYLFFFSCSASLAKRLRIVFSSVKSENKLFSAESFHSMCDLYQKHFVKDGYDLSDYVRACEPVSLGQYNAFLQGKSSCNETNEEDVEYLKDLLQECAPHYTDGTLHQDCDETNCQEVPENCRSSTVIYNIFHYLLPSDSALLIANGSFDVPFTLMITRISGYSEVTAEIYINEIQGRSLQDGITRIRAVGGQFKAKVFPTILLSDFKFISVALTIIIIIVWFYTNSLFVTVMSILDVVMAMVLSYFLYVVVYGISFFPFLNILTCILLLGIDADDTFIYIDIMRQVAEKHDRNVDNIVPILYETLHHGFITMFVTSFTTASALIFSASSSITAIKCFAVFSGSAVLINFVFAVTWLPASVVISQKYLGYKICEERMTRFSCFLTIRKYFSNLTNKIFQLIIPTIVLKLRYLWLMLFTLIGIGGMCVIFVYPRLKLPSKSTFQIFVLSDYIEQYDQIYADQFDFEKVGQKSMPMQFLWGLVPVDNGNQWDPDDRGSLVIDNNFNISHAESQEWLLQFCSDIKNQTFFSLKDQSENFCFIDQLKEILMEGPCDSPIFGTNVYPCCNNYDFPYEPQLFHECARKFIANSEEEIQTLARFDSEEELAGLMLSFTSSIPYSLKYETIGEFWNSVNQWEESKMSSAPKSASGGWFSCIFNEQLFYFDLQKSLLNKTPLTICLSLGVAGAVLLLTSQNVLITIYAILSIAGAVFVTVASLVLLGWEMDVLESIIMSLAVGLSVDFTIHYGVAYRIAPKEDRASKAEYAIKQLSSAITTAASSTFVAGVCMTNATILSYQQLGIFMTLVISISWAFATIFFMSLCSVIGPEGNCSQIRLPFRQTKRVHPTPVKRGWMNKIFKTLMYIIFH